MRGRFITFEGIDGSGKTTQLRRTVAALQAAGVDVLQTREPGGTPLAEALRDLLLQRPMTALAETLLMFAARIDHVQRQIEPALAAGRWVLCDRFTDATYAYQCGGRGIDAAWVASLESWTHPHLQPDLTVVVDLDPASAAQRRAADRAPDRFEAEDVAFFTRVRQAYLRRAQDDPRRFLVVDGAQSGDRIEAIIMRAIAPWLG